MTAKLSGFEQMVMNLMRAAGFDPMKISAQVQTYADGLQTMVKNIDTRLTAIDARLERLEQAQGIVPRDGESENIPVLRLTNRN